MTSSPGSVPFREALSYWLKLGATSFGGPAGQIAMLHDEVVVKKRWISENRFLHALNYAMILPGPEAQQLVTYIGWLMHGVRGGVLAGSLFIIPSLILFLGLSWVYIAFGSTVLLAAVFATIKPAVIVIIIQAVYRIGKRSLRHPALWGIAAVSAAVMLISGSWFPVIVVGAGLLGFVGARFAPQVFARSAGHGASAADAQPALIDDETPTPTHARISVARLIRTVLVFAVLWVAPIGILALVFGAGSTLVTMAMFFSGVALLTFGGAYAVLPYVTHGAVAAGWVTPSQMVDGLALGETTPGPLIMIVSFVGFLGGYVTNVLGANTSIISGVVASVVVTWFTFLPSFFFILVGGPFVESSRGRASLTAPLTAINAAVVGVVLSLAITFSVTVFVPTFPNVEWMTVDWLAVVLAALAAVALFGFKRSVIQVVVGSAVVGLIIGVVRLVTGM